MMKLARENYKNYITMDEVFSKTRALFGSLMDKYNFDEKDLEHRAKHGGMSIF